jgi:thiol-disulfide isomerase/thioredoxin
VLGALGAGYKTFQEEYFSGSAPESTVSSVKNGMPASCDGKKYCITVFIAPWCGACRMSEPSFHALHKYLPTNRSDVGFGLIIGGASAAQNSQKQSELAPISSRKDDSGNIMSAKKIKAFPTWIATDENGKEIFRRAGGIQISGDAQISQTLSMMLGH